MDLYKSEAPSSNLDDYTHIYSGVSLDSGTLEDQTFSGLYHGTRQWYYKLVETNGDTLETQEFPEGLGAYINDDIPSIP